jgi:hypothetical protein
MKKTITLTVMLLTSITVTYAQHLKTNAVIKANHYTYRTDSIDAKNMFAHNDKNIYRYPDKKPNNNPFVSDNLKKSPKSTINVFKKVFSDEKLHQLLKEGVIGIEFIVADDGKILETSFYLNRNTIITATELEQIEDAYKNDVTFKWIVPHTNAGGFHVITQIIHFNKILDGTQPE